VQIFWQWFPRNFVPSFSWGWSSGLLTSLKAFETARLVIMGNVDFDEKKLLF
jgi:hypothetical protein